MDEKPRSIFYIQIIDYDIVVDDHVNLVIKILEKEQKLQPQAILKFKNFKGRSDSNLNSYR